MSEHREQLVDIDAPFDAADQRVSEVRDWLQAADWTGPLATEEDWLHPGELTAVAGPRALQLVPEMTLTFFTVVAAAAGELGAWVAGQGTDVPMCPRCGSAAASDEKWSWVSEWAESAQAPVFICPTCAFTSAAGDWDLSGSIAFGAVGVVIWLDSHTDFDRIRPTLITELTAGTGGKWVYIHRHL